MARRTRSLTLIEGLILTGVFILLGILVVPFVKGARICANENEAVQVLRDINRSIEGLEGDPVPVRTGRMARVLEPIKQLNPDVRVIKGAGTEPFIAHHGYLFRLALDGKDETFSGSAIAWPAEIDGSGTAAFFIDERGRICYTHNLQRRYSGVRIRPRIDAARPRDKKPRRHYKAKGGGKQQTNAYIGSDGGRWAPFIP